MSCAYLRLNKVICGYFTAYWSQCVFLLVLNVLSRTDYDRNTAVRFWNQSHNAWFASHWQPISQCYIRSKRRMAHRPPWLPRRGRLQPTYSCNCTMSPQVCFQKFTVSIVFFTIWITLSLFSFMLSFKNEQNCADFGCVSTWISSKARVIRWVMMSYTHISSFFFFLLCHCESRCLLGWWWSSWLGTYPSVCTANNILTLSARVCWICVGLLLLQYKNQNWTSCSLSSPGNGLQQISINSHWLYVYFLHGFFCSSTATDWPCSFLLWRLSSGGKKVCEKRQHTYF